MNLSLTALLLIAIAITLYFLIKCRQEYRQLRKVRLDILQCSQDMYQTMAVGLYERLSRERAGKRGRRKTLEFENFVARDGELLWWSAFVGGSGIMGLILNITSRTGKYLGQVKCYAPDHLFHMNR